MIPSDMHLKTALHVHCDVEGIDARTGPTTEAEKEKLTLVLMAIDEALSNLDIEGCTIYQVCIESIEGVGGASRSTTHVERIDSGDLDDLADFIRKILRAAREDDS